MRTFEQGLHAPAVGRRHGVPGLGRAVVEVVDAVQVHVLRVPGVQRLPHAKVEVRRVHPLDLGVRDVAKDRVEVGDVPAFLRGKRYLLVNKSS